MLNCGRILAVAVCDFRLRFRQTSTAITFVLLCLSAYLIVPDPATGYTLMEIDGRRVFYNSAALALATACLYSLLLSLVGFYLVSNSIRKDIDSRAGFVVASTRLRNSEYLAGKLCGNIVFLVSLGVGFLLSCLVMYLIRGEARLEVSEFLKYYFLLLLPAAVFVSVMALLFESVPVLSGRFGDIVYFFLWMATMLAAAPVIAAEPEVLTADRPHWSAYLDPGGVAFVAQHIRTTMETGSFTVGFTPFDPTKTPVVLPAVDTNGWHLLARSSSLLLPLPLLAIAFGCFHRFDPARLRACHGKGRRGWVRSINLQLKPLARLLQFLLAWFPRTKPRHWFLGAVLADFWMALTSYPILVILAIGCLVTSLFVPLQTVTRSILPWAFLVLIPPLAEAACREKQSGTTKMVFTSPLLDRWYLAWKFSSSMLLMLLFVGMGLIRAAFVQPSAALSLVIGLALFAALATSLGVVSSNPKAFMVVSLLFWYLALSDRGRVPALDFAGWYGTATAGVQASYAVVTVLVLAIGEVAYWRQARGEQGA